MMYSDEQSRYSDVMRVCNQIIISSAEPILKCIETLCKHFEDDVIVIADYCTADGGNSVEILNKMKDKHNQHMYQAVCSKDMYKQCLPSNFMHLIFSTFGFHWLSERPCNIENGMFVHDGNEIEQKRFAQQAEKDWETFLLQRGKELKRDQEKLMWASCLTTVARVWSHMPMTECFQDHRTMADKVNLMNRFYDNLKTRLLECTFDLDYTIADLIISKT
ncbi:unnamed protein product [Mytilus coruscus]|uniref:Uncharacterized protein n=1 Tax=Mytilus coruscus TaxID=42192 RepID=A0A6J8B5H2_MYTCO|nr:unnamed protein product [Mytilus coruscus]